MSVACSRCGLHGQVLFQHQQYGPSGWEDVPDSLLCERCLEVFLDESRAKQDVEPLASVVALLVRATTRSSVQNRARVALAPWVPSRSEKQRQRHLSTS